MSLFEGGNKTELGVKIYTYIQRQEELFAEKYPLVKMKEPSIAGKITGMLLNQPGPNLKKLNEKMDYMIRRIIKAFNILEDYYSKELRGIPAEVIMPEPTNADDQKSPEPSSPEKTEKFARCYIDLTARGITSGHLRDALIEVHRVLDPTWMVDGKRPPLHAPILEHLKDGDYNEMQALAKKVPPFTLSLKETFVAEVRPGEVALHALFQSEDFEILKDNFLRNIAKAKPGTDAAQPYDPFRPILEHYKCHAHCTLAVVKSKHKWNMEQAKKVLDTKCRSLFMTTKQVVFADAGGGQRKVMLTGTTTTGGMNLSALTQAAWRYKNAEFKTYAETIKKNVEEFGGTNISRVEGINWFQNETDFGTGSSSGNIKSGKVNIMTRTGKPGLAPKSVKQMANTGAQGHKSLGAGRGGRVRPT